MKPHGVRGFALILTLSLLALVVLIVVAIASLTRVSSQLASTGSYQAQARQNALLGLSVALDELQRLAGPDGAVTAQSSIKQTTFPIQRLTGVWLAGSLSADPATWLVSGNRYPDTPTISPSTIISATDINFVALVDTAVTAAADKVRGRKVAITVEGVAGGHYAYWVGDEGCKASIYVPPALGVLAPDGSVIRLNPSGALKNYSISNPKNSRLIVFEQTSFVAPSSTLDSNFHHLTATTYGFPIGSTALKAGLFNINTRSNRAWEAVLRAYNDLTADSSHRIAEEQIADVAQSIGSKISTRTVSAAKVSRGPFTKAGAFRTSGIVAEALADADILTPTGDEILDKIETVLVVRSDTFRIRAYGDVLNPVSSTAEATAYCEAIVQRTTDSAPNGLGRKFVITYFRWLGPDDI